MYIFNCLEILSTRFFKALALFSLFLTVFKIHCFAEVQACAVLYEAPSFTGKLFTVGDGKYFSNLEEEYTSSSSSWNLTSSFKVQDDCLFTACNESHFNGVCQEFRGDVPSLTTALPGIQSVNCTCAADCRCSDVYMRKSSCARAYLKGGCNTCNSYYTDLKGERLYFPEEFNNHVASVLIRPGCKLTVYSGEDHEGESKTFENNVEKWNKETKIASYQCSCTDKPEELTVAEPRPRNPEYPAFIEVPKTADEISKMITGTTGRHPALIAALQSLKHKRSSRNAYILLLGITGGGKSSAINLLFDNPNLTKVGAGNSTTVDIHEFRVPVPVDELGVINSELRVIDTPGLGDTKGLEHDARFLATLDEFLTNHEELKHRIPNVVLIFHKFHDNRIMGPGSAFVKMLRGLDSFRTRITDNEYSNVIFVLSHYTSERKDIQRKPKQKLSLFKKVIQEYTLFPKPISIVVAENEAAVQELPLHNGYFRLPNGDYYPRNLFEKIQVLTSSGSDPIGESIITAAFRDSDEFNITSTSTPLVVFGNSKVPKYLSILNGAIYNITNTEVSQLLGNASESLNPELRRKYPDALQYTQKALNIRNILTVGDIPRTTLDIIKLLTSLKQNEAIMYLLDKGLSIKPPILKENPVTGYSYNVFRDIPLPISPLRLGNMKNSDIGYTFPAVMSCVVQRKVVEIFKVFQNKEDYAEYRLESLNVGGKIPVENFVGEIRPGSNIQDVNGSAGATLTAVREFRIFELVLNDNMDLTQEFTNALKALTPLNKSDHQSVESWQQFFSQYGTHVVQSAYGGGAIEIELKTDKPLGPDIFEVLFDFVQFAEDSAITKISNRTFGKEGIKHSLRFRGGDHAYHTTDLTKMTLDEAAKLLENWKESLRYNPSILTSETRLIPLRELAKKIDQNISSEIVRATELLFSSSLKYEKIEKTGPGSGREETTYSQGEAAAFTDTIARLMEESKKSDERFQTLLLKMEEDRKLSEKKREEAEEQQRQWEREQQAIREEQRRADIQRAEVAIAERRKWEQEMERVRQQAEHERQLREEEFRRQQAAAAAAAAARQVELLAALAAQQNRPGPGNERWHRRIISSIRRIG